MVKLINKPLEELCETGYDCECGRRHECQTKFIAGCGAIDDLPKTLAQFAPIGSVIAYVTYINRTIENESAERLLRKSGYMVARIEISEADEQNKQALDEYAVAEEARVFVAYDAGIAAHYLATKYDKKILQIVADQSQIRNICGQVDLLENGLYVQNKTCFPSVVLVDYNIVVSCENKSVVCSFANIFSFVLQQFDCMVNARINGENYCPTLRELTFDICKIALDAFSGVCKRDRHATMITVDLDLRVLCVWQLMGNDACFESGARQLSRVLKQLFTHEKRGLYTDAENDFILACIVAKIYRQMLENENVGFVFPPNNNLRMDKICENLGVSESVAAALFSKKTGDNRSLELYRMNEYRDELIDEIIDIDNLFTKAYKRFKRLRDDDGFGLLSYIDEQDLRLCLSLAPDLGGSFTLLSQMKNMGLLDKYL